MSIIKRDITSLSFEEFESLPMEEKLTILPLLPPKKRFDYMTDSRDGGEIVRSSPVVDLMVTIKEIGIEGAGALLSLCTGEQIQYFLDMDTWEGYTFSKDRMHRYLMVLRDWSYETLLEKYTQLDYEQQLLYLHSDFRIYLAKEDFNPDEGAPENTFTIDGVYYIEPLCDEEKFALVKDLLTGIFSEDHNLYLRLVEGMRHELYSNLEEDMYRFKSSRITELGFYEYEEAIGVYSQPTNIKRSLIPQRIDPITYSRLPVKYINDIDPVRTGFMDMEERLALEILFELQVLINRLIVADRLDMFEIESVEEASSKVKSLLRLGLDVMRSELGVEPLDAIKEYYVIDIFRYGYTRIKRIRDEARRIRSIHKYLQYVELPQYFESLLNIASTNFGEMNLKEIFIEAESEYPQSIDEVNKCLDLLYEIEASLDILIKSLNVSIADLEGIDYSHTNIPSDSKPNIFNLLLTPVANLLLKRGSVFRPLSTEDVKSLYHLSFVRDGENVAISEEFLEALEENIFSKIKENNPHYQHARRLFGRILDEYIAELGSVADVDNLNPEYISVLTILK